MPILTPEQAHEAVESELSYSAGIPIRGRDGPRKKVYLHRLLRLSRREIAIRREQTQSGVTVYINRFSCADEEFPVDDCDTYFPGVEVTKPYHKGYRGDTGDLGLISSAGQCPTLIPADHPVLRLSCSSLDGFRKLIRWYGGEYSLPTRPGGVAALPPVGHPQALEAELPAVQAPSAVQDDRLDNNGATDRLLSADIGTEPDGDGGRLADPAQRRAVERRAVDLAKVHYELQGFDVEEKGKPFDLLCTPRVVAKPGTPFVHVEVKGSTSSAATVHLTKNEIADARQPGKDWRSDLYVVSRIELIRDDAGAWSGVGGVPEVHEDWSPDEDDLTATDFVYCVPRSGRS
jgi:hypothetical protein